MTMLLSVKDITKSWGGNRVLDRISFEMKADTIGLVGPNGAGKSTLLNIIAGIIRADRGEVYISGRNVTALSAQQLVRIGLTKTNQIPRPFRTLTVRENLEVFSGLRGRADVESILHMTGLYEYRDIYPQALPFGHLKRLELAKALACNPGIVLLDEPLGGLSSNEAKTLIKTLKDIRKSGVSMIVVEHRLWELFSLVDEVVALDRGKKIFQGTPEQFQADRAVAEAYIGGTEG
ncbi:MAG: ATP-binding cassette domain-containing protein [Nitrososphaerota archaeon]